MSHLEAGGSRVALAGGMTDSSCSYGLNGRPRVKLTAYMKGGGQKQGSKRRVSHTIGRCEAHW
jgi:hypothetical protein